MPPEAAFPIVAALCGLALILISAADRFRADDAQHPTHDPAGNPR